MRLIHPMRVSLAAAIAFASGAGLAQQTAMPINIQFGANINPAQVASVSTAAAVPVKPAGPVAVASQAAAPVPPPIQSTPPVLPVSSQPVSAPVLGPATAGSAPPERPAPIASSLSESKPSVEQRFPAPPKPPAATELQAVSPDRITVRHGITARVEVSDKDPSLISTPFRKPKIVDNDKAAQARPMGGDVFVMPSRETTIFIKDGAQANSPVIGLHLVPVRRVSRSITLIMDGAIPAERRDTTEWANKPNDYVDGLRITMKQAVMGEIPSGYTEGPLTAPMAVSGNIHATPVKRYAGSDADIYRYRLSNKGTTMVTLSEEAFASDRVKAVTIFPRIAIDQGQDTEVFIMFAKENLE